MRKSISGEFFYLSSVFLAAAVVCIGTVLLVVSGEYYKSDRHKYLDALVKDAANATVSVCEREGGIADEELNRIYSDLSALSDADFTLVDANGVALVCSEASPCSHKGKPFGSNILGKVTDNGFYELSSLDNYYRGDYFNSAYKIELFGETLFVFGRLPINSLTEYILRLVLILLVVTVIVLGLVFLILYMSTKRILTPVREMTMAAKRFGKGDFSKKIVVADDNEFGFLANSLNKMAGSLEHIDETRRAFVSNVSHELKTPMTTIGGFIDGILDGTIPPEKHEHYLRIVSTEVNRLSRLVRSMLNISKYEAGELTINREDFDVVPMVFNTLLNFEKRIDDKNVEVRGLARREFIINADADLIGQVIYNLVENAVKFVNENGYIEFFFSETDSISSITIRNSGDGLNKEEISRVFDRFYKTDESRGMDPTGVGLGLSIVSSLVKLHNGTITVRSEQGKYTEFEVTLEKTVEENN